MNAVSNLAVAPFDLVDRRNAIGEADNRASRLLSLDMVAVEKKP